MTLIELENGFKIRFDHNEVRISIDGDMIDVGARRREEDQQILNLNEDLYNIDTLKYMHDSKLISDKEYENVIKKIGLRGN